MNDILATRADIGAAEAKAYFVPHNCHSSTRFAAMHEPQL